MKAKLFLMVFMVAGICWALVVSVAAAMNGFSVFGLAAPYAGIGLGTLGGFLIGALGLRMYTRADAQNEIKRLNALPRHPIVTADNPLDACQMGHREAYIDRGGRY